MRHDVKVTRVHLWTVAEIELNRRPVGGAGQRNLRIGDLVVGINGFGCVILNVGQKHRQHGFRKRNRAVLIPHNRERLTPVALTGKTPIPQAIGDGGFAMPMLGKPRVGGFLRIGNACHPIERQRSVG